MPLWSQDVARRGVRGVPIDMSQSDPTVMAAFMNAVHTWMAVGLGLTGVVAYVFSLVLQSHPGMITMPIFLGLFVVEMVLVVAIAGAVNRIGAATAAALFILYSALNGVVLSGIFLEYTHATLAGTFLVTAGMFAASTLYGMSTKRDLAQLGSLLFMALIGLILATIVNIFFASSMLYWITTYAGVAIFVGLTAYDTQKLQAVAMQTSADGAMSARYSVVGALMLYLDFLNLFLFMLRILGNGNGRQR